MKLIHGDCLEIMKDIPDKSIDMCLTDPPYGTTACKWDTVIPFEPMWFELKRIVKDNGAICLFGSEPFSSALRMSNIKIFKYDWYWEKNKLSGLINRQPIRAIESISVFYKKPPNYNEIKMKRTPEEYKLCYRKNDSKSRGSEHRPGYENWLIRKSAEDQWYKKPINILKFNSHDKRDGKRHPTQKPIALLEYLIKTYTLESETVLDFTMGSGSTGVACKNLNRKFIGIEKDSKYFEIAKNRIYSA